MAYGWNSARRALEEGWSKGQSNGRAARSTTTLERTAVDAAAVAAARPATAAAAAAATRCYLLTARCSLLLGLLAQLLLLLPTRCCGSLLQILTVAVAAPAFPVLKLRKPTISPTRIRASEMVRFQTKPDDLLFAKQISDDLAYTNSCGSVGQDFEFSF